MLSQYTYMQQLKSSASYPTPGTNSPVLKTITSNYSATSTDMLGFSTFTNTGAVAEVTVTLLAGTANNIFYVNIGAAQYLKFVAAGTDVFTYLGNDGAAGGYIRSNTIGQDYKVIFNNGKWCVTDTEGKILFDE